MQGASDGIGKRPMRTPTLLRPPNSSSSLPTNIPNTSNSSNSSSNPPSMLSSSLPTVRVSTPLTNSVGTSSPTTYEISNELRLQIETTRRDTEVVVVVDDSPPVSPSRFVSSRISADVALEQAALTYDCTYYNVFRIAATVTIRSSLIDDSMVSKEAKFYTDLPLGRKLVDQPDKCILAMTLATMSEHKALLVASFARDNNNRLYIAPQRITQQGTRISMTFGEIKTIIGDGLWRISLHGVLHIS